MKPYNKHEEKIENKVAEPEALYGSAYSMNTMNFASRKTVPDGYMTLDEFGQLFHKKLDDCYAKLQSADKQ